MVKIRSFDEKEEIRDFQMRPYVTMNIGIQRLSMNEG